MTEQRLGILGGMGRPTRLAPCGDPVHFNCPGPKYLPRHKVFAVGPKRCYAPLAASGPMPLHNRRDSHV